MRAILITRPGPPEVLRPGEVPTPDFGRDHILVRVAAAGINRADLIQRTGGYPAPPGAPQEIPGLEYAGVVEKVGAAVTAWAPGDRVMGLVGGGGYAEYVAVHEDTAVGVPADLSLEEAAAIPEVFMTAYDALMTQMRILPGQHLLIHGVGSGVGTAAVQLAAAARVTTIGTARSAWKLDRARELGMDIGIDVTHHDFALAALEASGGVGVNGVLDLVGGSYLGGNLEALAPLGRLVIVGLVAGARAELDMRLVLRKRLTIRGTVMRSRSLEERVAVARAFRDYALPLFEKRRLQPIIDQVLPMQDAARAHQYMAENRNFGKIVLSWGVGQASTVA